MNKKPLVHGNESLRRAREEHGWTQKELADALAIAERTVRSWERGERAPSLGIRSRLCQLLGKTPEQLRLTELTQTEELPPQQTEELPPQHHSLPVTSLASPDVDTNDPQRGASPQFVRDRAYRNRRRMLRRVRSTWIDGFLNHSLHHAAIITLGLQGQPDAVEHPWPPEAQGTHLLPEPLPPGTSLLQVYDYADGELLLLGEPGAGKTTLLLELARELLMRPEHRDGYPIPVVLTLSSWAVKQQPLSEWIVEELSLKYRVPPSVGQEWIDTNQLVLLLDGLDEVREAARGGCVKAINDYLRLHDFASVVVCCRTADYFAQATRISLQLAVSIQPLTAQQIDSYLSSVGRQFDAVRDTLEEDTMLQEMVKTPLMLDIVTQAYRKEEHISSMTARSLEIRRAQIFATYIQQMFGRRRTTHRYTRDQTMRWLIWLARQLVNRSLTEFYVERMQPDWLENERDRHHYQKTVIRLITIMQCLVGGGLIAWLKGGLKNGIVGSGNGILGLFGGGAGNSMLGWMAPGIGAGNQGGASLIIILGIVVWLVTILVGSPSLPTVTPQAIWSGITSGVRTGLAVGILIIGLAFPLFSLLGGIPYGLQYGCGIGFFLGMCAGLMYGLMSGLRSDRQESQAKIAFRDQCLDGLFFGGCGACGFIVVGLLLQVSHRSTLIYGTITGLFFLLAYGFGGGTRFFPSIGQAIKPAETVTWSWRQMAQDMGSNSKKSILVALVTLVSVSVVIGGVSSIFQANIRYGVRYGLVFGTISGLIVGIAGILTSAFKSGFSSDTLPEDQHTIPNEGVARSGWNALTGACLLAPLGGLASGLACGIGFGLVGGLSTWPVMGMAFALMLSIMFFVIFAIAHVGIAWIEHYTLRWYLWLAGCIPLHYVRFLNTASEYALIRKVGGGYMFTHRLLLEYFAHLPQA